MPKDQSCAHNVATEAAGRRFNLITMDTCCDSKADLPRIFFLNEPLAKFAASLDDCLNPDEPGMRGWDSFADVVANDDDARHKVDTDRLPNGKIRRSEIFELAADPNVSIATVCVAAMAWGGMNLGNWRLLWGQRDTQWLNVAECIRDGNLTREQAYERLKLLKKNEKLKGMGPAFFTKLIYFLTPRDKSKRQTAYIMGSVGGIVGERADRMEHGPDGHDAQITNLDAKIVDERNGSLRFIHRIGREHRR